MSGLTTLVKPGLRAKPRPSSVSERRQTISISTISSILGQWNDTLSRRPTESGLTTLVKPGLRAKLRPSLVSERRQTISISTISSIQGQRATAPAAILHCVRYTALRNPFGLSATTLAGSSDVTNCCS
jgi:hypothetical protein